MVLAGLFFIVGRRFGAAAARRHSTIPPGHPTPFPASNSRRAPCPTICTPHPNPHPVQPVSSKRLQCEPYTQTLQPILSPPGFNFAQDRTTPCPSVGPLERICTPIHLAPEHSNSTTNPNSQSKTVNQGTRLCVIRTSCLIGLGPEHANLVRVSACKNAHVSSTTADQARKHFQQRASWICISTSRLNGPHVIRTSRNEPI